MRRCLKYAFVLVAGGFFVGRVLLPAQAQDRSPVLLNLGADSLALHGYDAVAYVDENTARPGNPAYAVTHGGAVYQFATEANKNTFAQNPDAYLPQYGGWCAFGLGMDPDAY